MYERTGYFTVTCTHFLFSFYVNGFVLVKEYGDGNATLVQGRLYTHVPPILCTPYLVSVGPESVDGGSTHSLGSTPVLPTGG